MGTSATQIQRTALPNSTARQTSIVAELARRELARRHFLPFVEYTFPIYQATPMHKAFAKILESFAFGKIRRLIITMPPQHGKSELATRRLPAFVFGHDPNLKIAVASYNATYARKFNRAVQRIITSNEYHLLFPLTTLNRTNVVTVDNNYLRNSEEFEIVNFLGSLKAVGRGGPLTGSSVDMMIMDDLYKDYAEGSSPVIRESVIDWYTSVVRTRLHNLSRQLIVFTRWHEEDLIGYLERKEEVVELKKWSQLDNPNKTTWYKINFAALQSHLPTEIDPREEGKPLWAFRHSQSSLAEFRAMDEEKFESLYQGNPRPSKGLLYSGFNTYQVRPPNFTTIQAYVDTADMGKDRLCAIVYGVGLDNLIYILDVYYTSKPAEITEPGTAELFTRNGIKEAVIESNSGGRAFARNVDRLTGYKYLMRWHHQSENKEARIISNSAEVQRKIFMPYNWTGRWPEFARDILWFRRNFRSNTHDDAPDALTGVLEWSGLIESVDDALWRM